MSASSRANWNCIALLTLSTVAVGCVPAAPLVLDSKFVSTQERQGASVAHAKPNAGCTIVIGSISDKRSDPSTLGTVLGRPVHPPPDVNLWLRNVFQTLNTRGAALVTGDNESRRTIAVDIELLTAWVSDLRSAKTANAVVRVTYHRRDTAPLQSLYRGNASSINWSSGDGELQHLVDDAMTQLLKNMETELQAMCVGR